MIPLLFTLTMFAFLLCRMMIHEVIEHYKVLNEYFNDDVMFDTFWFQDVPLPCYDNGF